MQASTLFVTIIALCLAGYYFGYKRAFDVSRASGGITSLHSLPSYYGSYTALWCAIPALLILLTWVTCEGRILDRLVAEQLPEQYQTLSEGERQLVVNNVKNLAAGAVVTDDSAAMQTAAEHYLQLQKISAWSLAVLSLTAGMIGLLFARSKIVLRLRARNRVETTIKFLLISCASLAILTTVGIVLSVMFESIQFFKHVSILEFMFGTHWSPQMAIREDQVGSSGAFGAIPLFAGTLLISAIALIVAVPVGLMSAIYLAEYADKRFRSVAKPALEVLAGIPTVVYGFFAALTVAPFLRDLGDSLFGVGFVSSESALAAGLVMGVMIIPFVSSLSDDVISAVPQTLRDGSYGLGATKSETIRQVVIPAALPGIFGGVLLAASRAIGETMIVVMAAGLTANLTANPFEAVTTVTVQMVTLLVGDQEFDSPKTLAAFALGLMLFLTTLILNIIALRVVRKYREQYD